MTSARSITVAALALFLTPRGTTIGRHGETPEIQIFHLSGYSAITTYIGDNSGDTSFRFVNRSLRAVNLRGKSWIIRSSIGELSAYHVGPIKIKGSSLFRFGVNCRLTGSSRSQTTITFFPHLGRTVRQFVQVPQGSAA